MVCSAMGTSACLPPARMVCSAMGIGTSACLLPPLTGMVCSTTDASASSPPSQDGLFCHGHQRLPPSRDGLLRHRCQRLPPTLHKDGLLPHGHQGVPYPPAGMVCSTMMPVATPSPLWHPDRPIAGSRPRPCCRGDCGGDMDTWKVTTFNNVKYFET
ncbi:unnamed protein product [Caretta caretta]